jgi:hypothetical protein
VTNSNTPGAISTEYNPTESRLLCWLSWGVLLSGLGAGVASAYIVITTYSPVPHWDEWSLFAHLADGGGWSLAWLWAQHNEHRIFVTKLFFLLDVEFFHGTQKFLLVSIFLVQLLQVGLLSWSLHALGGLRGSAWRAGTGLIAYCILCPTQYENFVWGFQLQFVVPAAMATLAVLGLLLYQREGKARFLVACIAAATIATWSLANGMLLWPLLVFVAWWLRMKSSIWTPLLTASLCNIALYFYHYHRTASKMTLPLLSLGERARYAVVYLGSTFVRHSSGTVALIAGILGICAALIFFVRVLRHGENPSPFLIELSFLMMLCLATAAATSSGRIHLGVEQATASRYQTFALLFWCCLGLALLVRAAVNRTQFTALVALLLVMMLAFATQVRLPLIDAQWHQLRLKMVGLSLMAGVHDDAVLADAYPDPQAVLRAAGYMKQHRLSIFAGKHYEQLGAPLDSAYRVSPASVCSGYISTTQVLPSGNEHGLRLTGYAWDDELKQPARDIVAVTAGRITGFGSNVAIPLTSKGAGPHSDPSQFGWVTFVRDNGSGKVQLFAVTRNGATCPFAEISP